MPVRLIHRIREIYLPRALDHKAQSQEPPIQIYSPTKASSKGMGKLASRSAFHLQFLNITLINGSPTPGSTNIINHLNRVDLIAITVHSPSPHPQRMDSLNPTNTMPRKIETLTVNSHRRLTHYKTPMG